MDMLIFAATKALGTPDPLVIGASANGTTIQVLAGAAGWFIAAMLAYYGNVRLEQRKQQHNHDGTRRQMRTLLRRIIDVIDPFFWSFKNLQMRDAVLTYQQILQQLGDRQTAVDLDDKEWAAMDALLTRFGQMVALSQQRFDEWDASVRKHPNAPESAQRREADQLRLFFAQAFGDVLVPLNPAVQLFGDGDLKQKFDALEKRAMQFIASQLEVVNQSYNI